MNYKVLLNISIMNTSRVKFVLTFVICAFVFLFATTAVLDQDPEAFFGSDLQAGWQSTLTTIFSPIKIILIGPMLPFIKFLKQDPDTPPPFFLVGFAMYWSILAVILHYAIGKLRRTA